MYWIQTSAVLQVRIECDAEERVNHVMDTDISSITGED